MFLWTPAYGRAKAGRPARTYIHLLCEDTGCSPEDLPEVMNDREKWRERVRDIRASGTTWWWWWWFKIYLTTNWVECSPMAGETGIQSEVDSYQRLKKWYLIPSCLTFSIIRYVTRVKWSHLGEGVAPPLHLGVVVIEKGGFGSPSTTVTSLTENDQTVIKTKVFYHRCIICHF